ncbi:MAG: hypothetical protein N2Z74_00585, partial [Syntrophales bacterium]|nr:hypothetical protein [Syntrophales bacterium]
LDPKMYQVLKKLKEPSQFATTGKTPKNDFTYTGYIEADKVKVAVINGVEYREGEELDVKGFFVKNIGKGRVLIENRVTGVVKKIPLEE